MAPFVGPFVLVSLFSVAYAQDLSVPVTWGKFSNSRPLSERITISQNAINTILPQLNSATGEFNGIGYWQSGNVWSAMANQDHFTGQTTNQAQVVKNLNTVFNLRANYDQFGSMMMHYGGHRLQFMLIGHIRIRICYRMRLQLGTIQSSLLEFFVAHTYFQLSVVTASQASAGSQPNKNFAIAGSCDGATMAGGVFWRPTIDDQSINSITTGLYITTSAFLAEITGDSKYMNAAILSANWIKAHNINSSNIVLDTVNGHDCSRSLSTWLFTYNSGKYIEGLSVLADVTGDAQWRALMLNIVAAAVKSTAWQGSDGIITEGASTTSNNDSVGFKAIFIRGLYEAFARNPSNTNLRTLLHSYIDVQYNALLDLAANGSSYSSDWHGPPQVFTAWGQLAALDVLGSAIIANN
ncbi:endo-1,6-alpha-mannosidase [Crucibulum laeve]|uniref:Endo-1,6-alpha-mannosidase n=1 Tax=Crucibulum laeve TaxID=68775 RepID=A0A5C3M6V0_9AGAR|nr:endo-1,6-alpha-mannosidase [Crucibulum laeve]